VTNKQSQPEALHIESVRGYIHTQEEHHRQTDFIEELKRLLERNGVEYKPEFLM